LYDFDFILYILTFNLNSSINSSITKTKNKRSSKMAAGKFVKGIAVMSVFLLVGCVGTYDGAKNTPITPVEYGEFTDSRDGKKYKAVKIGSQTWMAENVNVDMGNSWCYEDNESNCAKYGRLYDWNTAMSVCPTGWHLSAKQEWDDLAAAAGGLSKAGKALKAKNGWSENGNGTDGFGFSALPGGRRYPSGSFDNVGYHGYWWTATESNGSSGAYSQGMYYHFEYVGGVNSSADDGFSVRCVQD
jgi:uncharacterized protein (TIGR02145 family)